MNQFEDFLNKKSAPENIGQFVEQSEQREFIDEAKAKVEGVLLYAPIPDDLKTSLLEKLEQINVENFSSVDDLIHPSQTRGLSKERVMSLWFNRQMRSAIPGGYSTLELALDSLYCNPSEYADKIIAQWMDSKSQDQN